MCFHYPFTVCLKCSRFMTSCPLCRLTIEEGFKSILNKTIAKITQILGTSVGTCSTCGHKLPYRALYKHEELCLNKRLCCPNR